MQDNIKIKKHYKNKYTTIDNIVINDMNLSFKARGLFCMLLNQYGTEFEISREEILSLSKKDGSISNYRAIKELDEVGLLKRSYIRKNGKIYTIKINLTFETI